MYRIALCVLLHTLMVRAFIPFVRISQSSSHSHTCLHKQRSTGLKTRTQSSSQLFMAPAVVKAAKSLRILSSKLVATSTTVALLSFSKLENLRSSAVIGGLLAGSLHAVTGPDHIAALLPSSVGHRWYTGARIGAAWGFGHGFSATVIGLLAFLLKDRISNQFAFIKNLSTVAESAVGVSLLLIGGLGLKESLFDKAAPGEEQDEAGISSLKSNSAIFTNGVLHGLSWDGFPSLMPTLAYSSFRPVIAFLLSYCAGTMLAMSATAAIVGEGSIRLGKATKNPDLPRNMSIVTSIIAIAIGAFWIFQAIH